MAYFLGIDGGGTKTRCVLADETRVLGKSMAGGCNIVRLGETQARESLHSAIRQACAAAKTSADQIVAVCVGAAGAARPEIAARIRSIISEPFPTIDHANIEVVGDTVIALEAAFGSGPGVIAIAGTGSIVYGRDAAGNTARAGGWGFAISDEGSGHWIGRRAISAIVDAHDRNVETLLTAMVLQSWKFTTLDELVQYANSTPPPDFPRLFPIVLRAADQSDAVARDLLAEAGARLAALAAIVVCRLAPPHAGSVEAPLPMTPIPIAPFPISMTGSVFRQSAAVRQIFSATLEGSFPGKGIDVRQDMSEPVEGALARARRKR